MDPTALALELPRLLSEKHETFVVFIARNLTTAQELSAMKRFTSRVAVVKDLLAFYIDNNLLYQKLDVSIDMDALREVGSSGGRSGVEMFREECEESCEEMSEVFKSSFRASGPAGAEVDESDGAEYRETSSGFVDQSAQTTVEAFLVARDALLVRNQGKFVSDYEGDLLGLAYPDLFPYGRGHPGTYRRVPVSFEECCRYYHSLSGRAFSKSKTFGIVVFDICGRRRVALSTCIRAKKRPQDFSKLGQVTREELAQALAIEKERREDMLAGKAAKSVAGAIGEEGDNALALLRSVRVSQSNMWGSPGERLVYRRRAFSLDAFLRSGSIFVTITPSDVGTMAISVLSEQISASEADDMQGDEVPSHARRVSIAGLDPLACTEYFEVVCEAFFESMVRFDKKTGLPRVGGGLFGLCKGYFGVAESQKNGTLHMHGVVLVAGLPRTVAEFVACCNDVSEGEAFKEIFRHFVDSVVSTVLPSFRVFEESNSQGVPNCKRSSVRGLKSVPDAAFRSVPKYSGPPATSSCASCGEVFGGSQILRNEVRRHHEVLHATAVAGMRIPLSESHRMWDDATERYSSILRLPEWPHSALQATNTQTFDLRGQLHALRVSQLTLLTQQHNYHHVPSCFKRSNESKKGTCRYSFPKKIVPITHIDDDAVLHMARPEHHEYINSFNDVMLATLRSNHDIRFLVGSGTTDALYYCLKYVTKVQNEVESVDSLLMMSFERRRRKEAELEHSGAQPSASETGRSRINSMAIALSRRQEISAPMCVLYLRRKSALSCSHDFAPVLLGQAMEVFQDESYVETFVQRTENEFVRATQYQDFVHRHEALQDMCLMEFVSKWERVKASKKHWL